MTSPPTDVQTSGSPRPGGFGALLRAAREARGLGRQSIADALRLSPRMVEAIESEDLSSLPPPLFIKGYLRSYAALVGLDEAALTRDFESWVPTTDPLQVATVRNRPTADLSDVGRGRQLASAILLLAVIGGVTFWWLRPASTTQPVVSVEENQAIQDSATVPDPVPEGLPETQSSPEEALPDESQAMAEDASPSGDGASEEAVPLPPPPVATPARSVQQDPVPATALAAPPAVAGKPDETPQEQGTAVLKIRYQQDCWTEVRDARGRQLIYRLAKAGSEQEVSGDPPFALYLGYAPGVEVAIDGRPVPIAPIIGSSTVARFKLERPR
ncbi:MAG: RodZ domain-containing protein [Pseudomonadota bacterium]